MASLVVETITPKRASELLALNSDNRSVRKGVVKTYARDMAAGNWPLTGAPIVLNGSRLLDGQHRLTACIVADTPFQTAVLYDADESIHFAIDKGVKRTIGDELKWRGEVEVHALGSILNLLWDYENDTVLDPQAQASPAELVAFLDQHPGVRLAVKDSGRIKRQVPLLRSAFGAVCFLLREVHGDDVAEIFVEKVATGAELAEGDPILALRSWAVNVASHRHLRPRREEWFAVMVKAANGWLLGRPIKQLRWGRVGPAAEPLPKLIGIKETA